MDSCGGVIRVLVFKSMLARSRAGWAAHLPADDDQLEEISAVFAVMRPDDDMTIDYYSAKAALRGMGFVVRKSELLQVGPRCPRPRQRLACVGAFQAHVAESVLTPVGAQMMEQCCPHAVDRGRLSKGDFTALVSATPVEYLTIARKAKKDSK